jgi:Flp pilus assembly protein TadG
MTRTEHGSAAVELAVIAPALVALLLLVVVASRLSNADAAVRHAAADAARSASLRGTPASATDAAEATVAANLDNNQIRCAHVTTTVDTAAFAPGGRVTVAVDCTVDLRDVALLALPGTRTLRGVGVEVVDRYRGDGT